MGSSGNNHGQGGRNAPNILLVVFDSLSAEDLHRYLPELPTLRALKQGRLNFANAYTCSPESSPARAGLFTGLDMAVHGVWTDGVALPKRETPLPEKFAAHGYQSWLVGRRQLAGVSQWTTEHARPHEYHHFNWAHGPLHRSRQNAYLTWLQQDAPRIYEGIFPSQPNPDNTVISDVQRDAMSALPDALSFNTWVGQQVLGHLGTTPFFGVAGFVVGRSMGSAAATVESLDPRALRQADAALGRILAAVPDNTTIALTAGRGSVQDATTPDLMQDTAIKVPLMIRLPEGVAQTIQPPVSTTDIACSLFALAKIPAPQRVQGRSLICAPPRGWALCRMRHPDLPQQTTLVTQRWKLVLTHGTSETTRLFDLNADPAQAHDLAGAPNHQDDLEMMMDLMIDARVALEDRLEPRIATF